MTSLKGSDNIKKKELEPEQDRAVDIKTNRYVSNCIATFGEKFRQGTTLTILPLNGNKDVTGLTAKLRKLISRKENDLNPNLTNGFSHHYHWGQSTFIFRGVRSDF